VLEDFRPLLEHELVPVLNHPREDRCSSLSPSHHFCSPHYPQPRYPA
jgi:hypothetical protein